MSQSIRLDLNTEADLTTTNKTFDFSSLQDAKEFLNFKLDSLREAGYPFLTNQVELQNYKLKVFVNLNQKIDSLYIGVNEEDFDLLPKTQILDKNIKIAFTDYSSLQNFIIIKLQNQGSSFGKAFLNNIRSEHNIMRADLIIERGNKRTIDKITIKGYPKLSDTYIRRFSNLKIGEAFVETEVQDKTEQLNNIPFVNVKKPTEVLFQKDSTELFLYLEKVKSNSFDGFLGFGSTEEDDFQLNGYLNVVLLNNLNFGERLSIVYKNDGIGQQTFEGNLKLPFILSSPLSLNANLRLFRRDSAFSNSSQAVNLNYQLNEKLSVLAGVESTNSTSLEIESSNTNPDIQNYNSIFYEIGFDFIKIRSRANLEEDTFLSIRGGIGKRRTEQETEQYKLSLSGQHLISLNRRNKIFVNINSQYLISDRYVNNELFRFGGVNSIRGFSENSLIANRFAVLQTEYRYILDSNLFANTVVDFGNYENKLDDFNENILGYGIGLGLRSRGGLFRLVLANAVSTNQESTFSNSKIHISFTSFF
ncbi:BamA/TamA family outer membrane protein [Psychroflexus tropicus]|uniref:BamA/TamA family outer membrane protein n=1 Tax=Psychroflexus tropicus TaxID=197345 RepID=UPI00036BBE8B|nr:BamA/TamA family outer membrane protein [Psychroflexus tropicus]